MSFLVLFIVCITFKFFILEVLNISQVFPPDRNSLSMLSWGHESFGWTHLYIADAYLVPGEVWGHLSVQPSLMVINLLGQPHVA